MKVDFLNLAGSASASAAEGMVGQQWEGCQTTHPPMRVMPSPQEILEILDKFFIRKY